MGGRGGASGFESTRLYRELGVRDINALINEDIEFMKRQPKIYGNIFSAREAQIREDLKDMYKQSWSGMPDGTILDVNPKNHNNYIIKEGDKAIRYRFSPAREKKTLQIRNGIVIGSRGDKEMEAKLSTKEKLKFLRRSILLRKRPSGW